MHFREATRADREAILALRARCFGDVDPDKLDPAFWDWEFGNARVFVGELDGAIVTHVALVNVPYTIDREVVEGTLAVDAMTAPEARGRGAFAGVVSFAAESTEQLSTAFQIRRAVLGAMLRGGYVVSRRLPVLVNPLIFGGESAKVSVLTRADVTRMAAIASSSAVNSIARTPEFLAWRFFDTPRWRYRVAAIGDEAYVVTRRVTLKGYDTLAIVDLAWRDRDAAHALVRNAVHDARAVGCRLAAALVSRAHPAFSLLLRRGFLPSPHVFRLLVYPPPYSVRKWRIMWGDTDHL
jgi:hypothetical protein